jgi:hypothetical protein
MQTKIRPEDTVLESRSDWIVGAMMAVFGVLGLVLAVGARDTEMFIFGASLLGVAVAFDAGLVKRRSTVRHALARQAATRQESQP